MFLGVESTWILNIYGKCEQIFNVHALFWIGRNLQCYMFSVSSSSSIIICRSNERTRLVHDIVCATVRIAHPQPSNIENQILHVLEDLNIKAFYISKAWKNEPALKTLMYWNVWKTKAIIYWQIWNPRHLCTEKCKKTDRHQEIMYSKIRTSRHLCTERSEHQGMYVWKNLKTSKHRSNHVLKELEKAKIKAFMYSTVWESRHLCTETLKKNKQKSRELCPERSESQSN